METQVNFFSLLPPQLTTRITSRLPLRSIANCMLVCKKWRDTLSNPFVAKADVHFLFFNRQSSQFVLLDHDPDPSELIELKPLSLPPSSTYAKPDPLLIDRHRVHSCNGLVFLSVKNSSQIYIYNPVIGEFSLVPKPTIDQFYCHMYDLGFCPTSDKFKLTRFVCRAVDDETTELEIYTDGWRRYTGDVPNQIWNKSETSICAKGVLHWLIRLGGNKRSILTFDLEEERFGSVSLPVLDEDKRVYKLGYMDDSLVVTAGHNPPLGLEIWARKERGVDCPVWVKNWVVDATESLNQKTILPYKLVCLIPRKLSVDGSIFLTYSDEQLFCYGPEEKLVKDFLDSINADKKRVLNLYPGLIASTATLLSPMTLVEGGSGKRKRGERSTYC